jgi:anti-sigma B factor antagonist
MPFDYDRTSLESGVQVLALSGTMTMGTQLQKFEWMFESMTKEQQNRIVLDMSKISYLDSSGIGVLVVCQGLAKSSGGQLRLAAVTSRVATILNMAGVEGVMIVDLTKDDAVSALTSNF